MPRPAIACCVFGALTLSMVASAQVDIGSGLRIDLPAKTMKDLRDQNVVRQRFDFSCGAAALATILSYGYGEEVTETQVLTQLFDLLSEDERVAAREMGFSLLNLQQVAHARGYRAGGFRLAPDQLTMLDGPVIVYIEPRGYRHFAVLRGVRGDRVYLADPSRGNIRMPVYAFLDSWLREDGLGIVFAVEPESGQVGGEMPLALSAEVSAKPEFVAVREMLAVDKWPVAGRVGTLARGSR